ncbi:MAG: WG repeat-containing protein, partial [Alistipes sp.]
AEQTGWTYDAGWNTRQFGAKLVDFLNAQPATDQIETADEDVESRLKEKYDQVFKDKNCFTVKLNNKYGIIGLDGKVVVAPCYDWMGDGFVDGMILFGRDKKTGYVNCKGVEVAYGKYDEYNMEYHHGIAWVSLNKKWGAIDTSGKEVIKPMYDFITEPENGFTTVKRDGKWGVVDNTSCKEVIPAIYDNVIDFANNKARVKLNGETFSVDTDGNRLNHVCIDVAIVEHDYFAWDADEEMVGGITYSFTSDYPEQVDIYVDDKLVDLDNDDIDLEESSSDFTTHTWDDWDMDEIVTFGYWENVLVQHWEFDVPNFDITKLSMYWQCFFVKFEPADYEAEEFRLTFRYDGKPLEEDVDNAYSNGKGSSVIWSADVDDDDECED